MSKLNELIIDTTNPFFNSGKWNIFVEFVKKIENFLSEAFVSNFKGFYEPGEIYEDGSFVWCDDMLWEILDNVPHKTVGNEELIKIKINGQSLKNTDLGYEVNRSDNPNENSNEILATTIATKTLKMAIDLLETKVKSLEENASNHTHDFSNITGTPKASVSLYGVTKLYNDINSNSEDLAASAFAVKKAYDKASHGHDYVLKGGSSETGQSLLNKINTKVDYVPGEAFGGLHRGAGNRLYWKGPDTGWIAFWDSGSFDPGSKLNTTGGTISGNLTVNGTFRGGNVIQPSDIRLKKEVKKIKNPLESIQKLNGYSYVYKRSGEKDMGVIAQEIEEVFPELVVEDETGIKAVKYNALIGVLIEAVKELKEQVDKK